MKCLPLLAAAVLSVTVAMGAEEVPDWAKWEYAAPADRVFAAALKSIRAQHYEVRSQDEAQHEVDFHVGITALSWGYNMTLTVTPIDEAHSRVLVAVARSGGKAVSWGSGKKQLRTILDGIDAELAGRKSGLK